MKVVVLGIVLILMSGCAGCGSSNRNQIGGSDFKFINTYKVFGPNSNKRIFLTHGIFGDDTQYDSGDLLVLRNGLIAKGYQVFTFSYPYTNASVFRGQWEAYFFAYNDFMQWMIQDINRIYGIPIEMNIGGFSFGGLHALIASAFFPFNKCVGILPVTDPSQYDLFWKLDAKYFNAFNYISQLHSKPIMITSSQDDSLLGFQNAQLLSNQIGANYRNYNDAHGHNTSPQMIQDILNYL